MEIKQHHKWLRRGQLLVCLVIAVTLAACGGDDPTPEPATAATSAPAATVAPATPEEATGEEEAEAAQAESPLAQPESPLGQPGSPLTTTITTPPHTEPEAQALAAITKAPEPAEGMATLSGVVYSFGGARGAVPGTQVYLEAADEVDGQFYPPPVSFGPKVAEGDIIEQTNDLGQIQMEVPPGNYYMAVWTIYDWLLVVSESGQEAPRLITLEEGDQVNLGVLYVNWP